MSHSDKYEIDLNFFPKGGQSGRQRLFEDGERDALVVSSCIANDAQGGVNIQVRCLAMSHSDKYEIDLDFFPTGGQSGRPRLFEDGRSDVLVVSSRIANDE